MSYDFSYLTGNMRSALKDSCAALKIKPDHLKALIRGVSNVNCFLSAVKQVLYSLTGAILLVVKAH